ncbi:bifunctional RNase H/acid phosphatase [Acrocarpospora pleiomorpha]|uniref:Bifunctional RNase H/acid phosphatase n=1 Tax=Acrocarpospora pleiomorpha TaxID=90975 RepID=A0A5M3XD41_9ACTN|nr:bifunctional RNase H/acid phosphatase [Acrocarpospora pleiomorpha]GES19020.1 bifunctional RNase H/acid phosphatase [Acrocarpospora pleiomorpha]
MSTDYVCEADGGSRGNPGPAGYGAVVRDPSGDVLAEAAASIGVATNNVAEYRGLIAALQAVLDLGGEGRTVEARMDSKLVIEQMAGRWKIKNEGLRPLAVEAQALARRLRVTWKWIPRERNSHADRLANEAMDAAARGETWQSTTLSSGGSTSVSHATTVRSEGPNNSGRSTSTSTSTSASVSGEPGSRSGGHSEWGNGGRAQSAGRVDERERDDHRLDRPEHGRHESRVGGSAEAASGDGWVGDASRPAGRSGLGWGRASRVATSLLLLRHGQTPLSIEKRFSGTGDPSLTPAGMAQAEAVAVRLAREPYRIEAIMSSPLTRARQTAEAVGARIGLPVRVDEGLREADFGAWEGHTFAEIQERWPHELAAWLADPAVAPPGGESFTEAGRRVERARDRILTDHQGKTVLMVSHVTPIKLLVRFALDAPPEALYRMHLDLACLSIIDYYADGPAVLRTFNDTTHLS